MSISPRIGTRGPKDCHLWNIIMYYWNGKVDSLWGATLPKALIISKNALNKSCSALQESQWVHMSISPRSGTRVLQRLKCLKYYNFLKWKTRFTLRLGMANWKRYIDQSIYRPVYMDMYHTSREIYRYVKYIERNISTNYSF